MHSDGALLDLVGLVYEVASEPVRALLQPFTKREAGRFAEYRRELATRRIVGDTVVVACLLSLAWHHKPVIRESDSCRKSSNIVKTDT